MVVLVVVVTTPALDVVVVTPPREVVVETPTRDVVVSALVVEEDDPLAGPRMKSSPSPGASLVTNMRPAES